VNTAKLIKGTLMKAVSEVMPRVLGLNEEEIAQLLDAGHFFLDEKNDDIASLVLAFLGRHSV
jgi:hypothetical protein